MSDDNPKQPPNDEDKIICIEGVTPSGEQFRPSYWDERMSEKMSSFKKHRMHYSPLLQPGVTAHGNKCILLDPKLKASNPELYNSILHFAEQNQLKICKESNQPAPSADDKTAENNDAEDTSK
jgi:hypothetical protein